MFTSQFLYNPVSAIVFSHNSTKCAHFISCPIKINTKELLQFSFILTIKLRVLLARELYHASCMVFNKWGTSGMRYTKWPLLLIFGSLYVMPDFWCSKSLWSLKNFQLLEAPSATTEITVKPASCSILMALHTTDISCSAVGPTQMILLLTI